ncbi:porin [Vibrio genomosp. F6]|uniref:porin n=1 Tax=Vibrio TaxID=662 RepID=UPI0010BDDC9B|nr:MULTISPECIES: porin [Vibrio]MDN3697339.1 porin [Vibrio cortegadensis]TKF21498.1 porin [Vibrio genomosp. F6]
MKKTLLSVLIANTLVLSTTAFASDDRGFAPQDTFFDDAMQFGGHVGSSIEYEYKNTTDWAKWGGIKSTEQTRTHEVVSLFYRNAKWNLSALYAFKLEDRKKELIKQDGSHYSETEDGYKHLLSLDKGFNIGGGWATGAVYDIEYTRSQLYSTAGTSGLRKTKTEHSFRPYLTYWSNEYNAGFYSNLEYLYNDEDKSAWGTVKEEGYSLLFKPYKRFDNWELGVEFFYQIKENDANGSKVSDFTEKYFEPIVQYSFDDAGTMYVRARIGENETNGINSNDDYFKDIRKATIGYEQAVGDDWLVKAEYEWAKDTETSNMDQYAGDEKIVEQNTLFLQALYRF